MNVEENRQIMAKNIRYYMEQKGVTKQQICQALGFKYTTFVDWYKGNAYPRIGKVEAMANYFGCEKSDLIEDKTKKPAINDGLSDAQIALIDFAKSVPADKAALVLRTIQAILADD